MAGPLNASVVIVGDYPGQQEANMKRPMVGGAGRLLWDCLHKVGIDRRTAYVTNVCKRQLHFSGDVLKSLNADERYAWESLLRWELSHLLDARLIIAAGSLPLKAFFDETGVNKWRGSVLPYSIVHTDGVSRRIDTLILNNPAAAMRAPREELLFRFNVAKAGLVLEGKYKVDEINVTYDPSPQEAVDWLDKMRDEARGDAGRPVSYDIEVMSGETACVGVGNSPTEAMCINLRTLNGNRFNMTEEMQVYRALDSFFGDEVIRFIAQNGNFDAYWMWYKDRIRVHANWFDTLLAHHTLYPTLPHGLGSLTTQYTTHPYYKDDKDNWKEGGDISEFWTYNGTDVAITWKIHVPLLKELRRDKLDEFFFNHVMHLQPHLAGMTVGGVLCDRELKEAIAEETAVRVNNLRMQFQKMAQRLVHDPEYYPNPGSWQQLQKLFFHKLKLIGRGTSTDAANRERMARHPNTSDEQRELLALVDEYAKEAKFLGTYAESRIDEDNRFRCEYRQFGTQEAPGRLSSAGVLWGTGANLQNQPDRAKGMFVADPGYVFGYFDLSQAEARFVAWDAQINAWKEQFEKARIDSSFDCHRALASDMWNIPYDEVPKDDRDSAGVPTLRFIAKRCRHGLNYRMGADRLQQTTGLPMHKAVEAYDIYHTTTPELRKWWDRLASIASKDKVLTTPMGRRLPILTRVDDEALRSIVAFRPQSTIGDKVSQVIYQSHEDKDWPTDARIILNIHDALIVLCRPERVHHCLRIMKRYAESPIIVQGEPMIIPAECAISEPDEHGVHRWSTLKKIPKEALE